MIHSQYYSSIQKIESHWRAPLEELLAREIPCLQWLEERDQNIDRNAHYDLFFHKDCLVGLLRRVARQLPHSPKKSFWRRSPQQKWLNLHSPGSSGHGLIYSPQYELPMSDQVLSIINQQKNYDLIQLTVPGNLSLAFPYRVKVTPWQENNILIKKQNYSDYLASLPPPLMQKIQQEKNSLHSQPRYQIITTESLSGPLKEKIQRHPFLSCYTKIPAKFLTLHDQYRPLTVAAYLLGNQNQAFVDIIFNLDVQENSCFHHLVLQEVIKEFFLSPAQTLRPFHILNWPRSLQNDLPLLAVLPQLQ